MRVCNIRCFYWLRELCEAYFHKPEIYGSGRAWANAWNVFRRAPSRGGRGRRADVDFVVCFRWGVIYSCVPRVCISYPKTQSSQRPIGEGAPTASQSAHRELAPTYPHQVYRLSVLPPEKYFEHGVIS